MRRGNTLVARQLPDTSGMLHRRPVHLPGNAGEIAVVAVLVALPAGVVGAFLLHIVSPQARLLWREYGHWVALASFLSFVLRFVTCYTQVWTSYLRHCEREKAAEGTWAIGLVCVLCSPVMFPVLMWLCCRHFMALRAAWMCYAAYSADFVANPGVLHAPGGNIVARWFNYLLAVLSVSMWVVELPLPRATIAAYLQWKLAWWDVAPYVLLPPVAVLLAASFSVALYLNPFKDDPNG